MSRLWIPAIHLPNGRDLFRTLPYRPAVFKKILKRYAERALLQCRPGDAVVLSDRPDDAYLSFLLANGLGTERVVVCEGREGNLARDILADDSVKKELVDIAATADDVLFYMYLEEETELAEMLGEEKRVMSADLTRMFNKQFFLLRIIEDFEMPSFHRVQVRSGRFEEQTARLHKKRGKLFVRGNESCGGSQVFVVGSDADLSAVNGKISGNRNITRYFVSDWLDVSESWNVQYALTASGVSLYGSSRQVLDEQSAHTGNRGGTEPPMEVMASARRIVDRLWEMGALGLVGIDLIVSGGTVYVVEVNPRQNSSTPALSVYRLLREESVNPLHFETIGVQVPAGTDFLRFAERVGKVNLFDRRQARGLLPYHFSAAQLTGHIDVAVFAESPAGVEYLKGSLTDTL